MAITLRDWEMEQMFGKPKNVLLNGDCLELIPKLKDKSIQLVVTSPPYFNSEKKYQRGDGIHNSVPVGEPLFDILEVMELLRPKVKDEGFICLNLGFSYSEGKVCLLYTSPSPRDRQKSRMPSSA